MSIIVVREWGGMDEWEHGPFDSIEEAERHAVDEWNRLSRFEKKDKSRGIEVCVYIDEEQRDSGDIQWSRDVQEIMRNWLKAEREETIRECAVSPRILKSEIVRVGSCVDEDYTRDLYDEGWRGSDDIEGLMFKNHMDMKEASDTLLYLALYEMSLKSDGSTTASKNRRSNSPAKKSPSKIRSVKKSSNARTKPRASANKKAPAKKKTPERKPATRRY